MSFIPYVGTRKNAQILTTTPTATTLATTNARLSEIDRDFHGIDTRWDNNGILRHDALHLQPSIWFNLWRI